jgi:hypothetical protein
MRRPGAAAAGALLAIGGVLVAVVGSVRIEPHR